MKYFQKKMQFFWLWNWMTGHHLAGLTGGSKFQAAESFSLKF